MSKEKESGVDNTPEKDPTMKVNPVFEAVHCDKPVTPIIHAEVHDDGTTTIVNTTIEQLNDPMSNLRVSDFAIRKLLAAGVNLHHIDVGQINHKIGVSSEQIAKFNANIDSLRSEIFVEPQN